MDVTSRPWNISRFPTHHLISNLNRDTEWLGRSSNILMEFGKCYDHVWNQIKTTGGLIRIISLSILCSDKRYGIQHRNQISTSINYHRFHYFYPSPYPIYLSLLMLCMSIVIIFHETIDLHKTTALSKQIQHDPYYC